MRKKRDFLSKKERGLLSGKIEKQLFALKEFKKAKTVMFYVTHRSEADTSEMIKHCLRIGKNVVVPKVVPGKHGEMLAVQISCLKKDLERGSYGVFEPKLERCKVMRGKAVDLVIVPGLVFDEEGYRVGYGKGYYDRWLKSFKLRKRIGLAFDFQLIEEVPRTKSDIPLGCIVTDERVVKTVQN